MARLHLSPATRACIASSCRSHAPARRYSRLDAPPSKQKFIPTSGTYPRGFRIGSAKAGIKPMSTPEPDLVLLASDKPSCGAAVFTKNEFPAASITVSKAILHASKGRGIAGIVANSGCANLLTGAAGLDDARAMSHEAAQCVARVAGAETSPVMMVMHTGVMGERLPMQDISEKLPELVEGMAATHQCWLQAARGIMTSDTFPKLVSRTFTLPSSPDRTFAIAGITKGAGMIHPNMATTLAMMCMDAPVTPNALQQLLSTAANTSYNCVSIEGDTSTNDMVAILANGAAGGVEVAFDVGSSPQSADFMALQRTLNDFMCDMAKLVVRDGEGATKFITIRIKGSPSYPAARHIASVIARSVQFKAGLYGKDPAWGYALDALGYSLLDTQFEGTGIIVPHLTSMSFVPTDGQPELRFMDKGLPATVDESRVREIMEHEDLEVVVDLRDDGKGAEHGVEEAVYWTCDLTHDFITLNS